MEYYSTILYGNYADNVLGIGVDPKKAVMADIRDEF